PVPIDVHGKKILYGHHTAWPNTDNTQAISYSLLNSNENTKLSTTGGTRTGTLTVATGATLVVTDYPPVTKNDVATKHYLDGRKSEIVPCKSSEYKVALE
ncbi:hypothetical protein CHS0354_036529, partial [Potamilus streckersoni]